MFSRYTSLNSDSTHDRPSRGRSLFAGALFVATAAGLLACGPTDKPGTNTGASTPPRQCDLRLSKKVDGEHQAGSSATYRLIVDNMGTAPCEPPITVSDHLPPGVSFASTPTSGWNCSTTSQNPETVECQYGSGALPPQSSMLLELEVDIGDRACMASNCAEVANGKPGAASDKPGFDVTPADNRDCAEAQCTDDERCVEPPAGMVGWWTGDQTGDDRSSVNNHGTLHNGAHYTTGQVREAFGLDGVDDHVKVADDASLNFGADDQFSIDAWIYPRKDKNGGFIVDKRMRDREGAWIGYGLQLQGDKIGVWTVRGSSTPTYTSSTSIPMDQWTHVTVTVDLSADQGTLYLDGTQDGTFQPSQDNAGDLTNDSPLYIGRPQFTEPKLHFEGRIDEVEIFSRVLTAGEVQSLVDAGPCGKCRVDCFDGEDSVLAGQEDDFADGPDGASPSTYLQNTYGALAEFDGAAHNDHFGHTFSDLKPTLAHQYICGATLEIRMRAQSGFPQNDTLRLSFSDGNGNQVGSSWGIHIGGDNNVPWYNWTDSLQSANWDANSGAQTFTLDLANLPASGSNPTNLMSDLNALAMLNIHVQDDTQVDWARLTVDYSCEACDFGEQSPDLAVNKRHDGELVVGQKSTYSIAVENAGSGPADPPTTITDAIPECMKLVGVKAPWDQHCTTSGNTVTCEYPQAVQAGDQLAPIEIEVVPTDECGDKVENCAAVSHDDDTNADNDESCVGSEVVRPTKEADLSIRKKAKDGVFTQGQQGVWSIIVKNNGPDAAQGPITVSDNLPACMKFVSAAPSAWSCSNSGGTVTCTHPGPLASGQSLDLELTVEATEKCRDKVRNCAKVTADAPQDPDYSNNDDCAGAEVTPPKDADLSIDKSHMGALNYGQTNTYAITVTNHGPGPTQGQITVTDALPKCMKLVSGGPAPWSCSQSGTTVTCSHPGTLAAGQSTTLNLDVHVSKSCGDVVQNCAKVSVGNDTNTGNDKSCDRSKVTGPQFSGLSISKTLRGDLTPGTTATYMLMVNNTGSQPLPAPVKVRDTLPSCMSFAGVQGNQWSCSASGQTVSCTLNQSVPAHTSFGLFLDVNVSRKCSGRVKNCAELRQPTSPVAANNTDCDTSSVQAVDADLGVIKSHRGPLKLGALNTYTIRVSNYGPADAQGPIVVTDDLPGCMRLASAGPSPWSCSSSGGTVTCTHPGPLPSGQSTDLKLTVKTGKCGDIVKNCADVTSKTDPDPLSANNRFCTNNRTIR